MTPGAPGTWNREVWWAINAASRRNGRRLVPPYRYGSLWVTGATPRHPYGRSTHASAFLTHLVVAVFMAWRSGRLVGWMARWRCGASTAHFRLVDEPDSVVCPACMIERIGRTS